MAACRWTPWQSSRWRQEPDTRFSLGPMMPIRRLIKQNKSALADCTAASSGGGGWASTGGLLLLVCSYQSVTGTGLFVPGQQPAYCLERGCAGAARPV